MGTFPDELVGRNSAGAARWLAREHLAIHGNRALAVLAAVVLAGLCLLGCSSNDRRISMDELMELEQQAIACAPIPVKPAELELSDLHGYRVQPRDVLVVRMIGLSPADRYAETVVPARVGEDGKIVLPIVGPIQAAGLELNQLERQIIAAHVPALARDLTAYIEVAGPEATTVLVLGAALTPGLVRLPQNQRNLLYALSSTGSLGPVSSLRVRLKPVRPERPEVLYDLLDQNDVRRALQAPPLESGDTLVVEAEGNAAVYVAGLVTRPALPVPTRSTIPLMAAIAASGGLIDFLEPDEATLWHTLANGERVQAKVDLKAIQAGCAPEPQLRPGDVVFVPASLKTRVRQWAAENLRFGPFGMTAVYDPIAIYEARVISNDNNNNGARATVLGGITSGAAEAIVPPVVAPTGVTP